MFKSIQQQFLISDTKNLAEYPGLNTVKAILIIWVIFGHCFPDSGMFQYFNYFFKMPLFLAISGFLLKEKAFHNGGRMFVQRLLKRLIIPWLIAIVIYLPLQLHGRSFTEISITDFLYPFYHLWYIPAYFIGAMICCAISRFKVPVLPLIILTGSFTVIWYIIFRENPNPHSFGSLYWMGDKRLYAYQFFFILGFSLRNDLLNLRPLPQPLLFIIVSSLILAVIFVEKGVPNTLTAVPYMFFNFSLAVFTLLYFGPQTLFQNKFLMFINKNSFGIYLFHPIIMMSIYHLIGDPEKKYITYSGGFFVGLITLAIVLPLVWLLQKWSVTNRFVLGNIKVGNKVKIA